MECLKSVQAGAANCKFVPCRSCRDPTPRSSLVPVPPTHGRTAYTGRPLRSGLKTSVLSTVPKVDRAKSELASMNGLCYTSSIETAPGRPESKLQASPSVGHGFGQPVQAFPDASASRNCGNQRPGSLSILVACLQALVSYSASMFTYKRFPGLLWPKWVAETTGGL